MTSHGTDRPRGAGPDGAAAPPGTGPGAVTDPPGGAPGADSPGTGPGLPGAGPRGAGSRGEGAGAGAPGTGAAADSHGAGHPLSAERTEDVGLLSPVRVGSAAEAATGDAAFLQAMLDAEAALTRAQAALGTAPVRVAAAVAAAARADRYDLRDLALRARQGGNPVIPLVADLTAAAARVDPGAAPYVHRGATSQDILDTALMLLARRALDPALADLRRAASALGALAAEHRATPMAGRTLTQHAVPTTFGLKAAGWRELVLDAHDRLAAVHASLPAQLGGAAGTLAAFAAWAEPDRAEPSPAEPSPAEPDPAGPAPAGPDPAGLDVAEPYPAEPARLGGPSAPPVVSLLDAYAAELGLAAPRLPWHALRTPVADLGAALAFTAGALGRLAEDVLVLSRTEIAEVAEGSGGGSSAMPHKSNPVRAVLIAAAARQLPAPASMLLASAAAADERPAGAWHAEWQPLREALRLVGGAARDAAELAAALRVRPERMRANLELTGGAVVSERLSAVLSARLGRGPAKDLLGRAARHAAERHTTLADALAAEPPGTIPDDLRRRLPELLEPARYLGAAPELVDRALARRPAPARPSAPRREESP